MATGCPQIKEDYKQLKKLKENYLLIYENLAPLGDRTAAKKMLSELKLKKQRLVSKITLSLARHFKDFEEKTLDYLDELLKLELPQGWFSSGLVGLDSERAWQMRGTLLFGKGEDKRWLAFNLAGLDSDKAWKLREILAAAGDVKSDAMVASVAGLDSDKAWQLRDEYFLTNTNDANCISALCHSLIGVDSARAWQMRSRFLESDQYYKNKNEILASLTGLDSEKAWQTREALLADGANVARAIQTLLGLNSEKAWKMRESLADRVAEEFLAKSLIGLNSERAWQMRGKFKEQKSLLCSLVGLNSDKAWELRRQFLNELDKTNMTEEDCDALVESLTGTSDSFVWQLPIKRVIQENKCFL